MKKIVNIIGVFIVVLLFAGCMRATYTKPTHVNQREKYRLTVNKDFDQVWKQLIQYSASTFFSIDNYAKDSGLITLTFGAAKPSEFVTGGHWKSTGMISFEGDYVEYLAMYYNGELNGKMNIVVSKVDDKRTLITVHARYIFSTRYTQYGWPTTWLFETGSCDIVRVADPAQGTTPMRTICPTYKVENAVINAVK